MAIIDSLGLDDVDGAICDDCGAPLDTDGNVGIELTGKSTTIILCPVCAKDLISGLMKLR